MEAISLIFLYFIAIYVGGLPGPYRTAMWLGEKRKRTAPTQDGKRRLDAADKHSMTRIAQLERESMAYWEERFIAAGGPPEKKEIIEPEVVRNTSNFEKHLSNVERQYREYINNMFMIDMEEYRKGMMHGSSGNSQAGANRSQYAGISAQAGRQYAGQVPTEYTRYSAH